MRLVKLFFNIMMILLLVGSFSAYGNVQEKSVQFSKMQADSLSFYDISRIKKPTKEKGILIHNNGKPIKLGEQQKQNQLFAVYFGQSFGMDYESYVFSNQTKMSASEIKKALKRLEEKMNQDWAGSFAQLKEIAEKIQYRNFSFSQNWWGSEAIRISSSIRCIRRAEQADLDGKKAYIWDIGNSVTEVETFDRCSIANQTTWFNVNAPNQLLLNWNLQQNEEISEDEAIQTTVTAGKDYSSKSGNYGKWKFDPPVKSRSCLKTNPGICVSTTENPVKIKIRHQVTVMKDLLTKQAHTFDADVFLFVK